MSPAPSSIPEGTLGFRRRCGWVVLLFGATLAAYWPVLRAGFIWDDDGHVTRPELRSLAGLGRIWGEIGATQQYYPVLHSAFWLEHRLWGDAALGYHLLNVLLHATAAVLFVAVLRRVWPAGSNQAALLAGLIFALHPVCVESVAWISEQKNTLSTVFYLLAALAYLRFAEGRAGPLGPPGQRAIGSKGEDAGSALPASMPGGPSGPALPYCVATLFFILALFCKSVTATLPAALLVVLWWRRGSLAWRRDILPLAPWFGLSLVMGLLTVWVERISIGAQGAAFSLSFGARCLLAGRIVWFYLGKLVWPTPLIFIYPRWTVEAGVGWQVLFPAGVLAALGGGWLLARRGSRGPLAVSLLFLGSLFPALGFFNVYPFVFSYVADHFQYLATLGVLAGAATLLAPLTRFRLALSVVLLGVLGVLTWRQTRIYRDQETFYRATVEANPASWLAQDNLGVVLARTGRLPEAIEHYREALRLNAEYPETHNNYGNALARLGQWEAAAAEYGRALRLRPGFAQASANWATAEYHQATELGNAGRLREAAAHYGEALRLRPVYPEALANLGLAEIYLAQVPRALVHLREAERQKADDPATHAYLGLALARSGQLSEAVEEYRAALRLKPDDGDVHFHLAEALRDLGRTGEATEHFEAARRPARVLRRPEGSAP